MLFGTEIEKINEIKKYKNRIEKEMNVKLEEGKNTYRIIAEDGLTLSRALKLIDALNAGFGEESFKLVRDEYDFIKIPIKRATKNIKERKRIISRVIGTKGKAKKNIEKLANVSMIVNDIKKEIYLLGKVDDLEIARESINRLIEGQSHGKVYSFLESNRRFRKLKNLY